MEDIKVCEICGIHLVWKCFPMLRMMKRKSKINTEQVVMKRSPRGHPIICDSCMSEPSIAHMRKAFIAITAKHKRILDRPPRLTMKTFFDLCIRGGFKEMFENAQGRRDLMPSVDRINSWAGYDLENIQIITQGDNASKNNIPALGAKLLTMRFFQKLREIKGLTKYEMALFLGMTPSTYYYYEDQARGCSFEILCLIKKKMEISWERIGDMLEDEFDKIIKLAAEIDDN